MPKVTQIASAGAKPLTPSDTEDLPSACPPQEAEEPRKALLHRTTDTL